MNNREDKLKLGQTQLSITEAKNVFETCLEGIVVFGENLADNDSSISNSVFYVNSVAWKLLAESEMTSF